MSPMLQIAIARYGRFQDYRISLTDRDAEE